MLWKREKTQYRYIALSFGKQEVEREKTLILYIIALQSFSNGWGEKNGPRDYCKVDN